jgi:hypothetical protein
VCALKTITSAVGCAATNTGGHFTLTALAPGSYVVDFDAGTGFTVQYYDASSSFAGADGVIVSARSTSSGVDAAMQLTGSSTGGGSSPSTQVPPATVGVASSKTASAPAPGVLALLSSRVEVGGKGVASVKIVCRGASVCHARIAILATRTGLVRGRRKREQLRLGSITVTLAGGRTSVEHVHLSAVARTLLSEHHGLLMARLSISAPSAGKQGRASARAVHLVQARAAGR